MRGCAALAVLFYHLFKRFYPGASTQSAASSVPHGIIGLSAFWLFGFGYLGVNLFFVVSGFCIHLPVAKRFHLSGAGLDIGDFAWRRFRRIYPAYFASLVWTSIALVLFPAALALIRHNHINFLATANYRSFLASAFFLQQAYPKALAFNGVYWTIVYEVQFYLFYPVLLWLCRKTGFVWVLWLLLAVELAFVARPSRIPLLFITRYYEWFVGMYLAERVAAGVPVKVPVIAFPLLLGLSIASVFNSTTAGYRDVIASSAFAVLIAACLQSPTIPDWFSRPSLLTIGAFSYSLYLTHVPIVDLFWTSAVAAHHLGDSVPMLATLLSVPAALLFAYGFYRLFEEPFIRQRETRPEYPFTAP